MNIKSIQAKSIITKSKLPDTDYVINPYTGCQFGCQYCYASFMGRFVNESMENWGHYVYAKTNAVELMEQEYRLLKPINDIYPTLLLSSVTDPYQPCEKQLRLTQGILTFLAENSYSGLVSILTKSPLVLRDVSLLQLLPNVEVGLTITSTDEKLSGFLEDNAPNIASRLETLRRLNELGIQTYAFIGPLLPHFRYNFDALESLIGSVANAGVKQIYLEHINLKPYIMKRMQPVLTNYDVEVQKIYLKATYQEHRVALQNMIQPLLDKYDLTLRLNKVIYHNRE
jgi:DNA repair photolyase